jgi:hypothetical protein
MWDRSEHDLNVGPVHRCQVCGSNKLRSVIDLQHQPLCDSLPDEKALHEPETTYPLHQVWCEECTLSQLNYIVPGEVVYHLEYPYRSGITRELATYQDALAKQAIESCNLRRGDFVIDIGSNDGTLLSAFKAYGMKVLGVEPTDIARIANENGIDTLQAFFDEGTAAHIIETYGRPRLVTATNVFAHMAPMGAFLRGIESLLPDNGMFLIENHYLLDIMKGGQFDTIYHEHLRSYSLESLIHLFGFYELTLVHAAPVSRYGGNIRIIVAKGRERRVDPSVSKMLADEREFGLRNPERYEVFRKGAERTKLNLMKLAIDCHEKGLSFVGNSCPGRASTLLNFCGIDRMLMPYICEQPTSLKLGRYLPGKHIPVVDNKRLIEEQPDIVVLLAWHYAGPIAQQLRGRGLRSKLAVPLPELRFLD